MFFPKRWGGRLLFLLLALIIFLSASVSGAKYNAVVWVTPSTSVEMSHVQYNISVNNYGSTHSITALHAKLDGLVPTEVVSISDWDGAMDNATNRAWWQNGTINNNVFSALFQFSGIAPAVPFNTTQNLTITTIYHNGHNQAHHFPVTIFDDATGPELANMTPSSGAVFIQDSTITAQIDAQDPETGVQGVIFSHGLCGQNTTDVPLARNESRHSASVNLSAYAGGTMVCFTFNAASGGGAQSTRNGTLTIDGAAPQVTAISPAAVAGSDDPFRFIVTDDASSLLACDVQIDGNVTATIAVPNGSVASVDGQPALQGTYTWQARCTDTVGHVGAGEEIAYLLDLTSPRISVHGIAGVLGPSSPIGITVTDNDEVASVEYAINGGDEQDGSASMEIDTSGFSDGINTLTVTATDRAGNTRTGSFTITVDKSAPSIALSSPLSTIDMHAKFQFTVVDTYDAALDCDLVLDGSPVSSAEAANGTQNTIAYNSSTLGAHAWRIDCTDDGGNTGQSAAWTVTFVDLSGPDITTTASAYQTRGKTISAQAAVDDISNVSSVTATVIDTEGRTHDALVEKTGSTYTITYDTAANDPVGDWTIRVRASDKLGNENTQDAPITITNAYAFTLQTSPDTARPQAEVTLTGTVTKDDGSAIPETQVKIWLPNGFARLVNVSGDGSFSDSFNAPADEGTHTVRVSVTEELTSFVHEDDVSFAVTRDEPAKPDTSGNRRHGSTDPAQLGVVESSPLAAGGKEEGQEQPAGGLAVQQEQGSVIPDALGGQDTDSDGSGAGGIGAATSIFSLRDAAGSKALWTAAIILLVSGVVALRARTGRKGKDNLD